MCLPALAIAGIVASAAGLGMNYIGQKKADSALNSTFNRERARQQAFDKEQIAAFEDSLASTRKVTDPAEMARAAAAREAALGAATKAASPEGGYQAGSDSAPSIVQAATEKAGAKADAATANLAAALGRLGGVGDQMLNNNINIGRNSQTIGQIGGFKRGSLDVLSGEMEAAKQKGRTLRTLGSLAQTIGGAMLSGGLGPSAIGGAGGGGINVTGLASDPSKIFGAVI